MIRISLAEFGFQYEYILTDFAALFSSLRAGNSMRSVLFFALRRSCS
jgi:hypothetical protein